MFHWKVIYKAEFGKYRKRGCKQSPSFKLNYDTSSLIVNKPEISWSCATNWFAATNKWYFFPRLPLLLSCLCAGQIILSTLCAFLMKTRKVWLFSAHLLPLLARFFAVPHATLLAVNTFSMGLTGAGATVFLLSHLFLPYRLARAAYSELVHMEVLFPGKALLIQSFSWERLDSAHVYFRLSFMHTLHLLVFSGVWVVQASCSWNLSVEPICRPSALQRLLVCSVHCAAMLRHHEWKCLIRPSGNYVLPAHKVQWNVEESTCLWVFFFFLRPAIDFFPPFHVQCLWVLCHSILSFGPDLRGVLSCSRTAQPMQVLLGRLCSCSEWKCHAQVR